MSEDNKNLKDKLTPEEYYVTQNHGTEPAFSGKYDSNKTPGTYHCVVCGSEIFSSKEKYDLNRKIIDFNYIPLELVQGFKGKYGII